MPFSPFTTVAVWRDQYPIQERGAPAPVIQSNGQALTFPVQIDPLPAGEEGPSNPFNIYCLAMPVPDVRRGDRLVAADGTPYVVSRVRNLYGDHAEIQAVSFKAATQLVAGTWKPRYSTTNFHVLTLADASDPHQPTGITHCTLCWDKTLQRATSAICPQCFGTGWTGGFAAAQPLSFAIQQGAARVSFEQSGQVTAVSKVYAWYGPEDATLLPGDLVAFASLSGDRFLVGEQVQQQAIMSTVYAVCVEFLPLAADNPLQAVPLT